MAENSKIEWTDHTFNPWVGCTKISPACDHCYAEGWAKRTGQAHLWTGDRRRTSEAYWQGPHKWNARAEREGRRYRVFCASLADVFDNQVPAVWRDDLWRLIAATPHLDWLLLTKRPQNIRKFIDGAALPNVWLGTTVETQDEAERRIPHLLATPAAVRWVSAEPLLGPLDLKLADGVHHHPDNDQSNPAVGAIVHAAMKKLGAPTIDWIVAGGESGPGARPMHPDWARSLRDQCANAGVPFHWKQWGAWLPGEVYAEGSRGGLVRYQDGSTDQHTGKPDHWWSGDSFGGVISTNVGKAAAGRLLDGVEHNGMPA